MFWTFWNSDFNNLVRHKSRRMYKSSPRCRDPHSFVWDKCCPRQDTRKCWLCCFQPTRKSSALRPWDGDWTEHRTGVVHDPPSRYSNIYKAVFRCKFLFSRSCFVDDLCVSSDRLGSGCRCGGCPRWSCSRCCILSRRSRYHCPPD